MTSVACAKAKAKATITTILIVRMRLLSVLKHRFYTKAVLVKQDLSFLNNLVSFFEQ